MSVELYGSSRPYVFCYNALLKIFATLRRKKLWWSPCSIKLWHGRFPLCFKKLFRNAFLQIICKRVSLLISMLFFQHFFHSWSYLTVAYVVYIWWNLHRIPLDTKKAMRYLKGWLKPESIDSRYFRLSYVAIIKSCFCC